MGECWKLMVLVTELAPTTNASARGGGLNWSNGDGGQCDKPTPTNGQTPSIQPAPPIAGALVVDVTQAWQLAPEVDKFSWWYGDHYHLGRHDAAAACGGSTWGRWRRSVTGTRQQGKGVVVSSGGASNECIAAQQANDSTGENSFRKLTKCGHLEDKTLAVVSLILSLL